MTNPIPRVTIHMVASLDGMIAKKDNSISWFDTTDHYDKGSDAPDIAAFLKTIDCYVMGARTYELALELSRSYGWAYGDTPTIVLSHKPVPVERQNVEILSGDLVSLVSQRLKPRYTNIWVVGGPALVKELVLQQLADEIRMSILPIVLGDGMPFFDTIGREQPLHLKDVTAYRSGLVELCYEIKKTDAL